MSSVTPIRPRPSSSPPERPLKVRIDAECQRIYQALAVIELAEKGIRAYTGDEDSLTIVEQQCTHTDALEGARGILGAVLEKLEVMVHEVDQEAQPA